MKVKYMPNAFSIARIVLCIPLAILAPRPEPLDLLYIIIFAAAGVTDAIDGQLARRLKDAKSELGATLDSIADICLVCIIVFAIMPNMDVWPWLRISYICVLLFKIVVSTAIGFIKFKEFLSLHTISFKLLIVILFTYPILYYFVGPGTFINAFSTGIIICGILIVIEEILIILMSDKPYRNVKSILHVKAENEAAAAQSV